MAAIGMEVELKFVVADEATVAWLLGAPRFGPFVAGPTLPAVRQVDSYLDTADAALERAGYAGRLRRTLSGTVLTLKSTATAAGPLQRREEVEAEAPDDALGSLDPRDWPPSRPRSLVLELCGEGSLLELVTLRQVRTRRELDAGDAVVELSVDEVDVLAGGEVVESFTEVEAELRSGDERRLAELRAVLEGRGLVAADGSKLERASRAVRGAARGTGRAPAARGEGTLR